MAFAVPSATSTILPDHLTASPCRTGVGIAAPSSASSPTARSEAPSTQLGIVGASLTSLLRRLQSDAVDMRDILPVTNKAAWNLAMRIHEAWEFYGREPQASNAQRQLSLDPSFTGQQRVQIARRRSTRPRRALPPPINDSAQVLAEAVCSVYRSATLGYS